MKYIPELQKENSKFKLISVPVGSSACNCYIHYDPKIREAIIIDPGDDATYIENIISDHNLIPKLILVTHGHSDHVGAVLELKLAYQCPFAISSKDSFLFKQHIDINLDTVKKIHNYKIVKTPGHTPGSVSLFCPENKICFVGDVVFEGNLRGRTDFNYSDPLTLEKSIDKIKKLGNNLIIYPGHGRKFNNMII